MVKDKTYIRRIIQSDIDYLKTRLRDTDLQEIKELTGLSPEFILNYSFKTSKKCWTVLKDDEPIVCFGVSPLSLLGQTGSVWLLATDKISEIKMKVLKKSKRYIRKMFTQFVKIENRVRIDNKISIAWLKWCGFTMKDAKPFGSNQEYYHEFYMRKEF